jgi:hypothetical protein
MTSDEKKLHDAGKKVYRDTGELVLQKVHQMDTVDDATKLVRDKGNDKEMAYANYANNLKSLANEARRESRSIKPTPVSKEGQITYAEEVRSLNDKLTQAKKNSPKERQAQAIAGAMVREKLNSNPDMDYEHRKREESRCLTAARAMVGAKKDNIEITDKEWEAIQANAISTNKLIGILNNTDQEKFKQRATPKASDTNKLSNAQLARIKSMVRSGLYTNAEIAKQFGISSSYVSTIANE